jgi:hypothetical protein
MAENQGTALDQSAQNGYTKGGTDVNTGSGTAAVPAGELDAVDKLPDLEVLSTIFTPQNREEEEAAEEEAFIPSEPEGVSGAGGGAVKKKQSSLGQGDFDVKELASAIQTVLKKDEKG